MTNSFSQVTIKVPTIPADFEAKAGTTKTDLAEAILALISGSQLNGVNLDSPDNFDLNEINNRLKSVEEGVINAKVQQRIVELNGIANGLLTIPFAEMPTANYSVNVAFVTPNTNINTVTWSVIQGSKQVSQCQIRIDGDANPYKLEVTITEIKS